MFASWTTHITEVSTVSGDDQGHLPAELPIELLLIARRRHHGSGEGFDVSEEFVFEDGRRFVINADRGFTVSGILEANPQGRVRVVGRSAMPDEQVREMVMNVIGPDEGEPEGSQPWERLAWLAQTRGSSVTAEYLRQLPLRIDIIR